MSQSIEPEGNAHQYARENNARFWEQYKELIRIPSISTQPEHASDVLRAAEWLKAELLRIGMNSAELLSMPEGRHPLVIGEWKGAGDTPTVLIYCHYDVQPAEMEDGWDTNPFEPVEKDGKLYARGTVDSKLHVMSQMRAVESILATEGSLPVNLKIVYEGEEESGSETFNAVVEQHPERMQADVVVISDGCILDESQPTLVYGLRGISTMELHVTGPQKDLHSGHFGGVTHNPIQALAEIIAQLHDENGHVTVPGFYDDVLLLDDEERESLKAVNKWVEAEWREVANAPQPWGEPEYTLHERTGARPTLEINGISGGYSGDGFKTVLPSKAMAKISCRLVADQDPQRIFECVRDHIAAITPPSVRTEMVKMEPGAPAVLLDWRSQAMKAARIAYKTGWGTTPIFERAGGSVPIAERLEPLCKEMVIMGFGYKSGTAHGPNENIHIESFSRGIHTAITFLQEIGKESS